MNRNLVTSSSIVSMAYDATSETLEVQFHPKNGEPGAVWQYQPVPQAVYGAMLLPGSSIGTILAREVKANATVVATRIDEVTA